MSNSVISDPLLIHNSTDLKQMGYIRICMLWDKSNPFTIHALQNQGKCGGNPNLYRIIHLYFLSVSTAQAVQFLMWQKN